MEHISEVLSLLDLAQRNDDVFVGEHPDTEQQRTFGGQVMAQALAAMYRTVPADRLCHSIKCYFLRAGSTASDILYEVDRTRDGGSFTTRRVTAVQNGHDIFVMSGSFKVPEEGLAHAAVPFKPPVAPEECPRLADVMAQRSPRTKEVWEREWAALDTRYVGYSNREQNQGPRLQMWMRAVGEMPDDQRLHQMVLAYASDLTLLTVSTLPHPQAFGSPRMQMATIDHSMWFHRPLRADEWVLYDQSSPNANNALGLSFGKLFDAEGNLGAHAVQEGLIRLADDRPRKGLI